MVLTTLRDDADTTGTYLVAVQIGADTAPNGPNVYVTVMWAHKAGADPINDHLWGEGPVSADPLSPNSRTLMWSQT